MAAGLRGHMQIGSVRLVNNLILAPMAGVSDLPFRLLCRECGAGLVCTEMVSAKAILYKNKNTAALMRTAPEERPVSLQLFGNDPEIVSEIAAQIEEQPFDILDFNMGCPVQKVVKNGEGSALMRDPALAAEIVRRTVKRIHKPMTVKIRKGFDEREVNAVELAKRLEDAGAAAVIVHGRTREQYYSGRADWDIIRQVKDAVSIPVIGNGDVTGPESARALQEETGCDGIMIGRAARGNPWIFRQILGARAEAQICEKNERVSGSASAEPDTGELRDMILRHAQLACGIKGEYTAIREMRRHVAWYTTGHRNCAAIRRRSNEISTMDDLRNLLTLLDS